MLHNHEMQLTGSAATLAASTAAVQSARQLKKWWANEWKRQDDEG